MKKFRKKPVIIKAEQWFNNSTILEAHIQPYVGKYAEGGEKVCKHCQKPMHKHGWIETLEEGHIVCPGDWIVKGIKGEFYPVKPDIFEQTYEAV
jgi:hypothetical protein